MKKTILTIMAIISSIAIVTPAFVSGSAYADDKCVSTSILGGGEVCDSGNGESILNILNTVVDFMSIGVGILAIIGITIVGIQYLTAGGNETQTTKAKRRLFEIVIGIAVYAAIYALLKWLMPTFGS